METEFFTQPRIWNDGNCFYYTKVEVVANNHGVNSFLLTDSASDERNSLGKTSSRFFEIVSNQPTVTSLTVVLVNPFSSWNYDQAQWKSFCLSLVNSMPNLRRVEIQRLYKPLDGFDWPLSILFGCLMKPRITHLSILADGIKRKDSSPLNGFIFEEIGTFKNLRSLTVEGTCKAGGLEPESWATLAKAIQGLKKLRALTLPLKALLHSKDRADRSTDQVIAAIRAHKNLRKHGVVEDIQKSWDALLLIKHCMDERKLDDPPTPSEKSKLPAWVGAMVDCLEKDRFDSFHYFFSKMDPKLYLATTHFKSTGKVQKRPRKRARCSY